MLRKKEAPKNNLLERAKKLGTVGDTTEYTLIKSWRKTNDDRFVNKLVEQHRQLVNSVANGYKGYGLPLEDIIAEAHLGLAQALEHFDTSRGVKFSTYAVWWMKAKIQEYVFKSWSMVSLSATAKHKRMFFKLRKLKIEKEIFGPPTNAQIAELAKELDVSPADIIRMEKRMQGKDSSLNAPVGGDGDGDGGQEFQDWLEGEDVERKILRRDEFTKRRQLLQRAIKALKPRERKIIEERRLRQPPKTLEELGAELKISKERVRQIENETFAKVQSEMKKIIERHNLVL